jgi:hypothetical protein
MTDDKERQEQLVGAYNSGRRVGFGVSALALSMVTYLSMLGFEKAILAIVLGALAMQAGNRTLAKRLGITSVILGSVFMVSVIVLVIVFQEKVIEFITLLKELS